LTATPTTETETLPTPTELPEPAMAELRAAAAVLENSSLAVRLASAIGSSVEALKQQLPQTAQQLLDAALRRALDRAMRAALKLDPARNPTPLPAHWLHRGLITASGMAGGALGLPGAILELPVSTTLLLRQIATIAAEEGEDLSDPAIQAECLKVFALGGDTPADDEAETGYFAVRLALAKALKGAVGRNLASLLPGFLGIVATRFGVPVTIKLSAQALPLLGAAAGAAVNLAFLEHFRGIARAHFTVRRLERQFGATLVRANWPVRA
jgi:EcsC protein family